MKNLIGYIRVSTNDQAESGLGLADQASKIRQYCEIYGLNLIDIVVDAGASAKSLNRDGIQQVMAMAAAAEVDGIIVAKLDRLTRSMRDLHTLLDSTFKSAELHSVCEKVDTSSASGRLVLNVLCSVAEWEREAIGERTSAALQAKKKAHNGESINGTAPYGQEWSEGQLVECHTETETINAMIHLRKQGHTYGFIAKKLNTMGHLNRSGRGWSVSMVHSVLKANNATSYLLSSVPPESQPTCAIISETIQAKKAKTGKSVNGRAPYGQKWVDGELVRCSTEHPIFETMKHLRELGQSYQQIADRLSAMGHITRRGGQWRASSVHNILKRAS